MTTNIFKLAAIALLMAGSFYSCTKSEESSSQGIYYVVGYDDDSEVILQNGTITKSETFLFISENLNDSLFAYNWNPIGIWYYDVARGLFDIIDIPAEMWSGMCGLALFPEEYSFEYKVQIGFRSMTKEEMSMNLSWIRLVFDFCPPNNLRQKFKPVIITSISKIQ